MIKLHIEGMTCGHCEKTVREALAAVPGVTAVVRVDRNDKEAIVEGDANVAALVDAVVEQGYDASEAA
jgi:copper chaperone